LIEGILAILKEMSKGHMLSQAIKEAENGFYSILGFFVEI